MSNYRIVRHRYALDAAVKAKTEHVFGNYIQIVKASSLNATIGVEMMGDNLKTEGTLELRNRDYIRVPDPFGRVDLSWDAQPGEWVEVIFITQDPAPEEFEYMTQERGFIESIAATVNVSTDEGDTTTHYMVEVTTAATKVLNANPLRKRAEIYIPRSYVGVLFSGSSNAVTVGGCIAAEGGAYYEHTTPDELWLISNAGNVTIGVREMK